MAGVLAVVMLLAGAFFAGRRSLDLAGTSGTVPVPTAEVWIVKTQTVGRTLTFSGQLAAKTLPGARANLDGVITKLSAPPGTQVSANDVLMTVDLRPVVAGAGEVPAFRDLSEGDRGPDVAQLRNFLCGIGRSVCSSNDRFTPDVTRAVRAWQKSLGAEADGVVSAGDILWFPSLPTRVYPAAETTTGASISADARPFRYQAGVAELDVPLTSDQAALIPKNAHVSFGDGIEGVVLGAAPVAADDPRSGSDASLRLVVRAANGTDPVCLDVSACEDLLGTGSATPVTVSVDVVPETTGPAVPVRAVRSGADGVTYVVDVDGTHVPVSVVGSSGGISVVDGVGDGLQILLDGG